MPLLGTTWASIPLTKNKRLHPQKENMGKVPKGDLSRKELFFVFFGIFGGLYFVSTFAGSFLSRNPMSVFTLFDFLGTAVFAISGAMLAMRKRFDPFGVLIIGFSTAVGGGTIRDVLIGKSPVTWMQDINYVYISVAAIGLAIIFRNNLKYLSRSLSFFDTLGLGIFTIIGTEIGVRNGFPSVISIILGILTATFGGVLRDILCSRVPIIFKKEIYATACISGAIVFLLLNRFGIPEVITYFATAGTVITIRLVAIKFKLSIPPFYPK